MTDSKEILILTAISLYIGYIVDHILCMNYVCMKIGLQYFQQQLLKLLYATYVHTLFLFGVYI